GGGLSLVRLDSLECGGGAVDVLCGAVFGVCEFVGPPDGAVPVTDGSPEHAVAADNPGVAFAADGEVHWCSLVSWWSFAYWNPAQVPRLVTTMGAVAYPASRNFAACSGWSVRLCST